METKIIPTVTAHTGCENTAENSLEAIEKAALSKADIFEADIRFDNEGIPVLSHDLPTGNEIKLEEAFRMLAQLKSMKFNIDIKETTNLKAIQELADIYSVNDRIFYTGVFEEFVLAVSETPEIPHYLNLTVEAPENQTEEYLMSLVKKVRDSNSVGINCHHENVTEELVNAFRNNGLLISVWTCNDEPVIEKMLSLQPDNITTKNPSLLKAMLTNKYNP